MARSTRRKPAKRAHARKRKLSATKPRKPVKPKSKPRKPSKPKTKPRKRRKAPVPRGIAEINRAIALEKKLRAKLRTPPQDGWTTLKARERARNSKGHFIPAVSEDPSLGGVAPTSHKDRRTLQRWRAIQKIYDKQKIPKPDKSEDSNYHKERGEIIHEKYRAYFWRFSDVGHARDLLRAITNRYNGYARARMDIGRNYGKAREWIGSAFDLPVNITMWSFVWSESKSGEKVWQSSDDKDFWYEVEILLQEDIDQRMF